MMAIIQVLAIPILIVNMFGGLIAGIWLAFLGQWRLILLGVLLLFTSHFYLSILMLPGLIIAPISARLYEKKNPLAYLFIFFSQFYTNLLIIGWCLLSLSVCMHSYDGSSKLGLVPYVLWSWGMALGPWQFFYSKEQNNEFTGLTMFCATIFYLLLIVSIFIGQLPTLIVGILFSLVLLFVLPIFNMVIANRMQNSYQQRY